MTFSNLSSQVSTWIARPLGFLIKIFGWNMDSIGSSRKIKAAEIIVQTASVDKPTKLDRENSELIIYDNVVPAKASLAKALLDGEDKENRVILGVPEKHCDNLGKDTVNTIVDEINRLFE